MKMNIHVDLDYSVSNEVNPTGKIYLSINDYYFPEYGWNDFVFAILVNWVSQAESLNTNSLCSDTFYFMDGPFKFVITKIGEDYTVDLMQADLKIKSFQGLPWSQFFEELKIKIRQSLQDYFKLIGKPNRDVSLLCDYTKFNG